MEFSLQVIILPWLSPGKDLPITKLGNKSVLGGILCIDPWCWIWTAQSLDIVLLYHASRLLASD